MSKRKLKGPYRDFLSRVARSIFANPFSDERVAADLEIIESTTSSLSYEERLKRVIEVVTKRMGKLMGDGKDDVRRFTGKDRIFV